MNSPYVKERTSATGRIVGVIVTLIIACIVALLAPTAVHAQEADVVYREGDVRTKTTSGGIQDTYVGDSLRAGESVLTGSTGFAELQQSDYSIIKVSPDTCFVIQEKEVDGEKRQVMETTTGSVFFRFKKMTEKEPVIQSPSYVCGVRGTEFTVYAGADGSSMILVDKGLVDVEAEGKTVSVTTEQGVEVKPSEPPGEVFERKGKAIDFREWNRGKKEAFLEDPEDTLKGIQKRLEGFQEEAQRLLGMYEEYKAQYDEVYAKLKKAVEEYGQQSEEADALREEFQPLMAKTRDIAYNYRYYALSAFSLKRYVIAPLYIELKTKKIANLDSNIISAFFSRYREILYSFEENIVPLLVEADI